MTRIDVPTPLDLNCTAVRHPDGWFEIRENGNGDGWIRTGSPVWIEM